MTNTKQCDVCGKFYKYYSEVKIKDVGTFIGDRLIFTNDSASTRYTDLDICSDCMVKIRTWLHDIAKDAEKEGHDD